MGIRSRKLDPNPHKICTWKNESECQGCGIDEGLNCRFQFKDLLQFYLIFLFFGIPAFLGMRESGYGSYLIGWGLMAVLFFGVWEIRILCSHCPYYAKSGFMLHCIANYGCPKIWKYRPGPMSRSENIQLIIGFALMAGYPFVFMILGNQIGYAILSGLGLIIFFGSLIKYKCSQCINFSCVFNRVPQKKVNAFLNENPVMRDTWKEAGWDIDES